MVSIIQQCPLLGLIREINDLRLKVSEMGSERLQYEKKHKSTKDELASLKEQLEEKESEVKRLQEKLVCKMKGEGIEIVDRVLVSKKERQNPARPRTTRDSPRLFSVTGNPLNSSSAAGKGEFCTLFGV
ncbi:liprin-beta-1-like isoform X5 [Nomascus leucogenys]|uniref:liprin-beta-1-like isoform X5 n=1 Tax=Nomascus leucogenys TaxID=61853 RepID=UPI00122D806D|nr:liprin-beta-1-like isoform X5 [Nomascus leucogenys]